MALGAGSVTPMQMATAYSVFANGGYRVQPMLIQRITDNKGKLLQESKPPVLDESDAHAAGAQRLRDEHLLQEVARSGTARGPRPRSSGPTCTARPAPPTIPWTPGLPASSPRWRQWCGSATTTRASWVTAKPAAAWRCRCGSS
jgi:hypothetical protein